MRNVVTRFAPWQSAKALALTYFFMGFVIAVPMALMSMFVPAEPGQAKPGPFFFFVLPFMYGIASLIFVPIACWIYNKAAGLVGGLELNLETKPEGGLAS
jgi:hypothetical protein